VNTKLVNSAAGVILAALTQNRTAAGIALALDSAQMLMTPEVAAELEQARLRVDEVERAYAFDTAELKRSNDALKARITELEAIVRRLNTQRGDVALLIERERGHGEECVDIDDLEAALALGSDEVAEADGITRQIVPVQALREDDPNGLHHTYRLGRDLPETGGAL
jgi:hypothetical protein